MGRGGGGGGGAGGRGGKGGVEKISGVAVYREGGTPKVHLSGGPGGHQQERIVAMRGEINQAAYGTGVRQRARGRDAAQAINNALHISTGDSKAGAKISLLGRIQKVYKKGGAKEVVWGDHDWKI